MTDNIIDFMFHKRKEENIFKDEHCLENRYVLRINVAQNKLPDKEYALKKEYLNDLFYELPSLINEYLAYLQSINDIDEVTEHFNKIEDFLDHMLPNTTEI